MAADSLSRRNMIALASAALPVAALALSAEPAAAYQGNMERALAALQEAYASLQAATPNKGGHREHAMELIQHAMNQVQLGIEWANHH